MRILAVLAEARSAAACLEGAWAAAEIASDAVVEALHVKVDPDKIKAAPEEITIQHLREQDEGSAEDRAKAVREEFDRWRTRHKNADPIKVIWTEKVGPESEIVAKEAEEADLTVLARPHDLDAHDAMHSLIYGTTRPLLIPTDWQKSSNRGFASHIAIAWKASEQTRHAIKGALPWLRNAVTVTLILVGENDFDGDEAAAILRDNGISPDRVNVPKDPGSDLAEQILGAAQTVAADALVIGAYKHSEVVEWFVGGTTKELIAKARIPLFLSH